MGSEHLHHWGFCYQCGFPAPPTPTKPESQGGPRSPCPGPPPDLMQLTREKHLDLVMRSWDPERSGLSSKSMSGLELKFSMWPQITHHTTHQGCAKARCGLRRKLRDKSPKQNLPAVTGAASFEVCPHGGLCRNAVLIMALGLDADLLLPR